MSRDIKILNFGHPVSNTVLKTLDVSRRDVEEIPTYLDLKSDMPSQIAKLVDSVKSVMVDGSETFAVMPPKLVEAALVLLLEMYGRCGWFPPLVSIRKVDNEITSVYGANPTHPIIDLNKVKSDARSRRWNKKIKKD